MVIFGFWKILFLFYIQNFPKNSPVTSGGFPEVRFSSFRFLVYLGVFLGEVLQLRYRTRSNFGDIFPLPQKFFRRWFYSFHHNSKANSYEIEPMWGIRSLETLLKNDQNGQALEYRFKMGSHEFIFSQNCLFRKRGVQMRRFRNRSWTKF